jgi:hypothetical protein
VIDDWAMAPLSEPERRDFWEICEDRYQVRSLILTSQLPVSRWHEQIGDPTVADGILDRLVHKRSPHRDARRFDAEESREAEHVAPLTLHPGDFGYAWEMSTTKEELHTLVEQVPADKVERVLKLLKRALDLPATESAEVGVHEPMRQLMRQHWKQVGDRIGLDVDQLPKNGGMSGGVSGNQVKLTKDWESEDARHRLSKLDVHGHEIILLERMTAGENSEFRYEVRVFTEESEGRAELSVPVR